MSLLPVERKTPMSCQHTSRVETYNTSDSQSLFRKLHSIESKPSTTCEPLTLARDFVQLILARVKVLARIRNSQFDLTNKGDQPWSRLLAASNPAWSSKSSYHFFLQDSALRWCMIDLNLNTHWPFEERQCGNNSACTIVRKAKWQTRDIRH